MGAFRMREPDLAVIMIWMRAIKAVAPVNFGRMLGKRGKADGRMRTDDDEPSKEPQPFPRYEAHSVDGCWFLVR